MNATAAVSKAPVNSDPAQTGGAGSADSARPSAGSQDFAAALSDAVPKPAARKPVASKVHNGGAAGGQLPVPGNLSPPATLPAAAAAAAAAAALATAAGAAASAAAGAQGVGANSKPGAAADTAMGTAPGALPCAGPGATTGVSPDATLEAAANPAAQGKAGGLNSDSAGLDPAAAAPGATGAASFAAGIAQGLGLPAASAGAPVTTPPGMAGENAGARRAIAQAVGASASPSPAGVMAGAAATAATAAATSGPGSADGGASTYPDATTQTPSAAALAAAVSGAVASSHAGYAGAADSSSSVTDDLATPATGGAAQDAGGSIGSAVQAGAAQAVAAMAHAAAAAAVTTPINAQAVAALAGAGTPDKHSQDGCGNSLLTDTSGNSVAGTAQISTTLGIATDATPTPTLNIAAAVETPEFGQGLADRVSWMVDNNLNGAKLQVNPPQLGPIEVRIAVQGAHAQVWLTSHSAITRDALEASSPKLREMLSSQGFGQVSVDISQRSFQERSAQAQPYDWTPAANRGSSTASQSSAAVFMPRTSSGAVDAYA